MRATYLSFVAVISLSTVADAGFPSKKSFIQLQSDEGMCVAKKNGGWANGNPLHLWSCGGSQANVLWIYDAVTKKIQAANNKGKCIAKKYGNTNAGNPIHLWDCNAGAGNLSWIYNTSARRIQLLANPTMCLAKKYAHAAAGNPMVLAPCNGDDMDLEWKVYNVYYKDNVPSAPEFMYESTGKTFYVACPPSVTASVDNVREGGKAYAVGARPHWQVEYTHPTLSSVSVSAPPQQQAVANDKNKWKVRCQYKVGTGSSNGIAIYRYVQAKSCTVASGNRAKCRG